jgi:hypothetical protein
MFVANIAFAMGTALLFTFVFRRGLKRPGPWSSWLPFFLVLLLAGWAGGLWISPVGPVFMGIYWLPIVMIGLLVSLLLAAASLPTRQRPKVETISEVKEQEAMTQKALDAFFWILLVSLLAAVVLGYYRVTER